MAGPRRAKESGWEVTPWSTMWETQPGGEGGKGHTIESEAKRGKKETRRETSSHLVWVG